MSESPADASQITTKNVTPEIPIEIVSEEEMALIDAAFAAAARCSVSSSAISAICSPSRNISFSSRIQKNARPIQSITLLAKRSLSGCSSQPDIEDSGNLGLTQKRSKAAESFYEQYRKKRGLAVTDLTGTEWCEKQMEFVLHYGKRRESKAMKAGRVRHEKLEEEVTIKVKVLVKSVEDRWALKLINFIHGVNQLLFDGLTRELPILGFMDGVWMVGVIDEIQMPAKETDRNPILVDTKTRVRDTLPAESQKRNGRLQLMCYKYMWDNLPAKNFTDSQFFDFFSLNRHQILSEEIRENIADAGFPAHTLEDIVRVYRHTCSILPPADNQLLLRYELQKDQSLLGEVEFEYDDDWFKSQIQGCLEFWKGEREASYPPEEERWKCQYCQFKSACPATSKTESSPSSSQTNSS